MPLETACAVFERYVGPYKGEAADRFLIYLLAHKLEGRACSLLVAMLQPEQHHRSLSHNPLFQTMLILQNHEAPELQLPGLEINPLTQEYPIAKFDLTLTVAEQHGQLHCNWEYATDLFEQHTIERIAAHLEVLVRGVIDNPGQSIHQLPLLAQEDIQQLQAWNATEVDYPRDQTIADLF